MVFCSLSCAGLEGLLAGVGPLHGRPRPGTTGPGRLLMGGSIILLLVWRLPFLLGGAGSLFSLSLTLGANTNASYWPVQGEVSPQFSCCKQAPLTTDSRPRPLQPTAGDRNLGLLLASPGSAVCPSLPASTHTHEYIPSAFQKLFKNSRTTMATFLFFNNSPKPSFHYMSFG